VLLISCLLYINEQPAAATTSDQELELSPLGQPTTFTRSNVY